MSQSRTYIRTNYFQPKSQCSYLIIQPKHSLQFVCTAFQISALLKITLKQQAEPNYKYTFLIKATNKTDYKVSQPNGRIMLGETKNIIFQMKQSAQINKNLRDKFLLVIIKKDLSGKQQQQTIYSKKLTLLVESALQKRNAISTPVSQNYSDLSNVSKLFASVYKSPDHQQLKRTSQNKSELRDTLLSNQNIYFSGYKVKSSNLSRGEYLKFPMNNPMTDQKYQRNFKTQDGTQNIQQTALKPPQNIRQSKRSQKQKFTQMSDAFIYTTNSQSRLELILAQQLGLKTNLNDTNKKIQQLKRNIMILDNQNKSIKARARFRIYFTIFIVIFAFFMGIWVKSFNIPQHLQQSIQSIHNKFSAVKNKNNSLQNLDKKGLQDNFPNPHST